jgi:hypothetical protein
VRILAVTLAAVTVALGAAAPATAHWRPTPTTAPWQWQMQGRFELVPGASAYDLDGFRYSAADVFAIQAIGARAVCYIDAGTWEEDRPDAARFPKSVLGIEARPGARWLNIVAFRKFAPEIERRIAMCARKGFDAVDPDELDAYVNRTGFRIDARNQLRYNRWIAAVVHAHGMAVALQNDSRQVEQLVGSFDFAVVERCFQYQECEFAGAFVDAHKAVFEAEFALPVASFCRRARHLHFAAIRKNAGRSAQPWKPCGAAA